MRPRRRRARLLMTAPRGCLAGVDGFRGAASWRRPRPVDRPTRRRSLSRAVVRGDLKPRAPAVDATCVSLEAGVEPFLRALVEVRRVGPALQGRLAAAGAHRRTAAQAAGAATSRRRTPSTWSARCCATTWSRSSTGPTRPTSPTRMPGVGRFRVNAFRSPRLGRPGLPPGQRRRHPARRTSACRRCSARWRWSRAGWCSSPARPARGKTTTLAGMIDHDQQQPRGAHRHDRGPDRGPALRQARDDQPARGPASTPTTSPPRCAPRCARTPTSSWSARCATRRPCKAALAAAETGHFVMSTLHTTDAQETINRDHRLLPAARAEAGPARAGRRAARHRLPAPGAARRRPGPLRRRWRSASTPAASPTPSPTRTRPPRSPS